MTKGGYTQAKLEWRAAKRGRSTEDQLARDSRSRSQIKRDTTGRGYIAPPEPKPKSAPSAPVVGKKKR